MRTLYATLLLKMKAKDALKLFQEKLLASKVSPYILKIILFGSFAKGKETAESDLDVLVLSSNGQAVHNEIAKIAFSLQMDYGVPIEPMVEEVDEILHPSYFLYNVLNYGKEAFDDLPGSHGGVVGRFGELFVKTKKLKEDLGGSRFWNVKTKSKERLSKKIPRSN